MYYLLSYRKLFQENKTDILPIFDVANMNLNRLFCYLFILPYFHENPKSGCGQELVKAFPKSPPPEETKLKHWWTYLSQLRLSDHHMQGIKIQIVGYI